MTVHFLLLHAEAPMEKAQFEEEAEKKVRLRSISYCMGCTKLDEGPEKPHSLFRKKIDQTT